MEAGYIYAYRQGWEISKASTIQSAFLSVALLVVGAVFFHEGVTVRKLIGVLICLTGLIVINT